MRLVTPFLSVLVATAAATAQTAPATESSPSDALQILSQVTQKYADAKSLHLEATQELTHNTELSRSWSKMVVSVTVAPDNRYRYEGRGPTGAALLVSDGNYPGFDGWFYHPDFGGWNDAHGTNQYFVADFDSTPEPSSLLMLGTGVVGAIGILRRRL